MSDMETLRVMDARNADIGKGSMLKETGMTTERLAALIYSSSTEGGTGPM